ncbi:MAG: hypothetical protein UFD80_10875 [Blautia sp.]|uniref:hypothetical protein n=1 Tax=Blautia sp. TaxID=1955243 RepID=UPI002E799641|nr:hypothetical protein [Blautia sp.]MED9883154.1 hypothetical protein [Blautia sp.]
MTINKNSLLATMNPAILLLMLAAVGGLAYVCARRKRNTNDFSGSVKIYIPAVLVLDIVFWVLGVPLILLVGFDIVGFVILALISNYYFYH